MNTPILIGCDPELFVRKNGVFLSAYGLIPGDKRNPHPVRNGAVQIDGMALEFNIAPAKTEDEFCLYVQDVLDQLKQMVPDYEVVASPVAHFSTRYMSEQPFQALELGCDPDFDGWTGEANIKPEMDLPMRTASGHIHIGFTQGQDIYGDHFRDCMDLSRQLDYYLGLPSLLYDDDVERRTMYGKGGCFRPKPYGVEYRTLSNAWLKDPKLMRYVYRQAVKGTQAFLDGERIYEKHGDISDIINNSDVKRAKKLLKKLNMETV